MAQDKARSARTASLLRGMAHRVPEIANDLHDMANKLDDSTDAIDLAARRSVLRHWCNRMAALQPVSPLGRLSRRLRT
jgi:hypothetical protein